MAQSIGELFVSLGFDVDDNKLKSFNSLLKEGLGDMLKLSAAATGAVVALNIFLDTASQRAVALRNFTNQTGYSAESLQKWQSVVHQTNPAIGIEQAAQSYKAASDYLLAARQGRGAGELAMLGVNYSANMTPDEMNEAIRARLPQATATYGKPWVSDLLKKIYGTEGVMPALQLSKDQFDTLGQEGVVSQENLDKLAEFAKRMAEIDVQWNKFKMDLAAQWAPVVIAAIDDIEKALERIIPQANEFAAVLGGWQTIGEVVLAFYTGKWLLGMLASIGRVTAAFSAASAASAALAGGAALGTGAVAVGALGAGAAAGYGIAKYSGFGQWVADKIAPVKSWGELVNEQKKQALGNKQESFNFWKSLGFTDAQAAGMVANEERESSFNPGAVGDMGAAHGIFQWHPDRVKAIKEGTGIDVTRASHIEQLRAAAWEMQRTGVSDKLHGMLTPEDSAALISNIYERPANAAAEATIRGNIAKGYGSPQLTQNNTMHVNTTANAHDTASEMKRLLDEQTNAAFLNTDLGPRY